MFTNDMKYHMLICGVVRMYHTKKGMAALERERAMQGGTAGKRAILSSSKRS